VAAGERQRAPERVDRSKSVQSSSDGSGLGRDGEAEGSEMSAMAAEQNVEVPGQCAESQSVRRWKSAGEGTGARMQTRDGAGKRRAVVVEMVLSSERW
jgi:hypothetical protein